MLQLRLASGTPLSHTLAAHVGLVRGAQAIVRAREIATVLMGDNLPPTRTLLDCESLRLVAARQAAPGLSRYSKRRYVVIGMRMEEGQILPQRQPDTEMMADFGTKWLSAKKLRVSLRYATNSVAWHGDVAAFHSWLAPVV